MSRDPTLRFAVTLNTDDLVAWNVWSYRQRESRTTRWLSGYVFPACVLVVTLIPPYTIAKFAAVLVGIILSGLYQLWRHRRMHAWYARAAREPAYTPHLGEQLCVVEGLYISIEGRAGAQRLRWTAAEDVAATDDHIFVLFHGSACIFPRVQLSPDVERALLDRGSSLPSVESAAQFGGAGTLAEATFIQATQDTERLVNRHFRVSRSRGVRLFLGGAAIGAGSTFLPWIPTGDGLGMAIYMFVYMAAVGGGVCLAVGYGMAWEAQRRYARQVSTPGQTRVALTPASVGVQTTHSDELISWSAVDRIELEPKGLLFQTGVLGVFVPRRAFQTESEFQDFVLVALKLHDQHRTAA